MQISMHLLNLNATQIRKQTEIANLNAKSQWISMAISMHWDFIEIALRFRFRSCDTEALRTTMPRSLALGQSFSNSACRAARQANTARDCSCHAKLPMQAYCVLCTVCTVCGLRFVVPAELELLLLRLSWKQLSFTSQSAFYLLFLLRFRTTRKQTIIAHRSRTSTCRPY